LQNNAGNAILSNPVTPVTHTFATAVYHPSIVRTALVVRVTNTGRLASGPMNIEVTGTNGTAADAFEITAPAPATAAVPLTEMSFASLARGTNRTFSIRPKAGLGVGTHTATVTITSEIGAKESFNISFTVSKAPGVALRAAPLAATRTLAPDGLTASLTVTNRAALEPADTPATANPDGQKVEYAITTNTATVMTPALDASLTWDEFSSGDVVFDGLRPHTNYFIWARTVESDNYLTGAANNSSIRRSAAIQTSPSPNGINHGVTTGLHTFAAAAHNYAARPVQTVTITNVSSVTPGNPVRNATGTLDISIVNVGDHSTPNTNFEIVSPVGGKLPPIAGGGTATFTVRPVQGLAVGTYTATVLIRDEAGNAATDPSRTASYDVAFTVTKAAGSTVSNAPVAKEVTATTIEVHPVTVTGLNPGGQVVEYAITTTTAAPAASAIAAWDTNPKFENLNPLTVYYVHARTRDNTNNNAGAILRSGIIQTDTPDFGVSHGRTGAAPHLHTFPAAAHGYAAPAALAVTISNIGKNDTGALDVRFVNTLPTDRAISFVVSTGNTLPGIPIHNSRNITVRPVTGLDAGIHTATLLISGGTGADAFEASFRVSFTVNRVAGVGAVLSGVPTILSRTQNQITMNTLTIPVNFSNQEIEYAITTNNAATMTAAIDATLVWETFDGVPVAFDGLAPSTVYYVWARARATPNHNAGAALRSTPMQTAAS
jgi:hypothetical protein